MRLRLSHSERALPLTMHWNTCQLPVLVVQMKLQGKQKQLTYAGLQRSIRSRQSEKPPLIDSTGRRAGFLGFHKVLSTLVSGFRPDLADFDSKALLRQRKPCVLRILRKVQ